MSLYAIADLHLSLGTDKPMDVFRGWSDYVTRLEKNWKQLIGDDDTVVIAGDISWAMRLEECYNDFKFINELPGKKIFVKGNHDYWWSTKRKIDLYLEVNGFDTIKVLFNNSFAVDDFVVCGTRGWYYDLSENEDKKVLNREAGRLKASLEHIKDNERKKIVFLHYPPVYGDFECREFTELLSQYDIKQCYYGHLHGVNTHRQATVGMYNGVSYHLISCDYLNFVPVLVR